MSHLQALFFHFQCKITGTGFFTVVFRLPLLEELKKEIIAVSVSGCPVSKITKRLSRMRQNPVSGIPHIPLSRHTHG